MTGFPWNLNPAYDASGIALTTDSVILFIAHLPLSTHVMSGCYHRFHVTMLMPRWAALGTEASFMTFEDLISKCFHVSKGYKRKADKSFAGDVLSFCWLQELSTIALPRAFLPLACTANLAKNLAAVAASSTRAPIYRTFALQNNLAGTLPCNSQLSFSASHSLWHLCLAFCTLH